jgi:HTH-type transcriptional regulator/antitoxin MqsA
MTELNSCPVCESDALSPEIYSEEIEHTGTRLQIEGLERMRCAVCDADPVLTPQIRRNQVRIADAKRRSANLLTGRDIKAIRESLGMSQPEAAHIFGGGANAFSKYERGEVIQSVPMDRLLRVAATYPWAVDSLRILAGQSQPSQAVTRGEASNSWNYGERARLRSTRNFRAGNRVDVSDSPWKAAVNE